MLAAKPELQIYASARQTPQGAVTLDVPRADAEASAGEIAALAGEHRIDAFWPQDSAMGDLSSMPCTIHAAATPDVLRLVDDKSAFMAWLDDDPHRPDQADAFGADGVEEELARRNREGRATCVKPAVGVNGQGYWRFMENGGAFVDDPAEREIDAEVWLAAMRLRERERPAVRMLVMDWLPGPEVTLDLLCWRGEPLAHAARTKIDPTHQRVCGDHAVAEHGHDLARRLGLHGIVSMQYRKDAAGRWRMLEVNPRPAGGCIHSEDAGFTLIADWTLLVMGEKDPADVVQHHAEHLVRFVRSAQIVS